MRVIEYLPVKLPYLHMCNTVHIFFNSTLCLNDASSIASNQSRLNYIYCVSINSVGTAAAAVLLTKPK